MADPRRGLLQVLRIMADRAGELLQKQHHIRRAKLIRPSGKGRQQQKPRQGKRSTIRNQAVQESARSSSRNTFLNTAFTR